MTLPANDPANQVEGPQHSQGLFGRHVGTIWRAQLPERFKATLQAVLLTVRSSDMNPHAPVSTYTARYFADVLQLKSRGVNARLQELEEAGLISREVVRTEGRAGARVTIAIHMDEIEALPRVDEGW
jgi:hypothetical protein